jgi:hypothetical protein
MKVSTSQYDIEFGGKLDEFLGSLFGHFGAGGSGHGGPGGVTTVTDALSAAECSNKENIHRALEAADKMDNCIMGPLRIYLAIVKALSAVVGATLGAINLGPIASAISMLSGSIQSLGDINMGIIKIHTDIAATAAGIKGHGLMNIKAIGNLSLTIAGRQINLKQMKENKGEFSKVAKEMAKNWWNSQAAVVAIKNARDLMKKGVGKIRKLIDDMDTQEKKAIDKVNDIFKIANLLKTMICSIFALLRAFLSSLQAASIAIGIQGTIVAEVVQVLQAILSALAAFFAALQDMLNFLSVLITEAEGISLKMFDHTLSLVKEKFRELKYAAFGGPGGG